MKGRNKEPSGKWVGLWEATHSPLDSWLSLLCLVACPRLSLGLTQVLSHQSFIPKDLFPCWRWNPTLHFTFLLLQIGTHTCPFPSRQHTPLQESEKQSFLNNNTLDLFCCSCLTSLSALYMTVHDPLGSVSICWFASWTGQCVNGHLLPQLWEPSCLPLSGAPDTCKMVLSRGLGGESFSAELIAVNWN